MSWQRGLSALAGIGLTALAAATASADGDRWFPRLRRAATQEQPSATLPDASRRHPVASPDEAFQTVRVTAPAPVAPPAAVTQKCAPSASSPDVSETTWTGVARPFPTGIVRVSSEVVEPVAAPASEPVTGRAGTPSHVPTTTSLLSPVVLDASQPAAELAPVPIANTSFQLGYFEHLALTNHPTLGQLSATVTKASALRCQVQTYPNPTIGYSAQQLADRGTDQHMLFVEQQIVLGDKLRLNANVLGHAANAQSWELESQRYRVLTDVRLRYYEALVAQERLRLTLRLERLAEDGVAAAEKRRALVDPTELLQTEIQLQEIQILREQAKVDFRMAWQGLVAAAGTSGMASPEILDDENWGPMAGSLLPAEMYRDWEAVYNSLLSSSPELHAARGRVDQARANLARQQAQPIPNLDLNLGAGYDRGTQSQMINVQVGAPMPLFNKNRGNISAAYADYCRATKDVERIELSLKSRLADSAREFDSAVVAVARYDGEILPRARENLQLTEKRIEAVGELSDFIPLIIARRTLFETELQSIRAQGTLAQAAARLDGFLLSGGLEATTEFAVDDGLRGQTLEGQ